MSDPMSEIQGNYASDSMFETHFADAKQKPKVTNFYPNNIKKEDKMKC